MDSEIIYCPRCREFYHFYYDDDDVCVSETSCGCIKIELKTKPLDRALNKLKEKNSEQRFYFANGKKKPIPKNQ